MPDNELNGDFSQVLRQLMDKPEISNLITSLKNEPQNTPDAGADVSSDTVEQAAAGTDDPNKEATGETAQQTMPSLSPDMLAKLPAIMSMLSGMGFAAPASEKKSESHEQKEEAPDAGADDAQRKALLKALRPYLNDKRRTVVDSMLQLEDLTKLFGAGFGR